DPPDAAPPGLRAGADRRRRPGGGRARVTAALGMLSADRQSVIILAFWVLVGAGIVVSVGAWILLRRESRAGKPPKGEPPAAPDGAGQEPAGKGSGSAPA